MKTPFRTMKEYLVRFVQMHETFRVPELKALAKLADLTLDVMHYDETVGFVRIHEGTQKLIRPSLPSAPSDWHIAKMP